MLGIGQYDRIDRRKVRTREDQVLFNGKKYRRDKNTRVLCLHDWRQEEVTRGGLGGLLGL